MPSTSWTVADIPDLTGRTALVTGANAGLGFEVARALAARGGRVLLACRSEARGEAAATAIRDESDDADVLVVPLDLADQSSVAALASRVIEEEARLDLLVGNAGVMAVDRGRTVDGHEVHIGVNHMGHMSLTLHVLPLLRRTPGSRVVVVSSALHRVGRVVTDDLSFDRRRYGRWRAYSQSKLANLLFVAELDRRLRAAGVGVAVLGAHPGSANTSLGRDGSGWTNLLLRRFGSGPLTQSAADGASSLLRAATDASVESGAYVGPRWGTRGAAAIVRPSRRARSAPLADALWDRSEIAIDLTLVDVIAPPAA